jgi:hypothetical protein
MENWPILALTELNQGYPGLTPAYGAALAEAAAVCLNSQGHRSGTTLTISGDVTAQVELQWPGITDQMLRCWHDEEYTTEQGAYGIACLLIHQLTPYTIIERSIKGTGFDYWLGDAPDQPGLPFQQKIRLEVSGIRKGIPSRIRARVERKKAQTQRSDGLLPAYVIVVEFSHPLSIVVQR